MGRGKSKVKKLTLATTDSEDVIVCDEDDGVQKRRTKPQKQVVKDDETDDDGGEEDICDQMTESYEETLKRDDHMNRKRKFEIKESKFVKEDKSESTSNGMTRVRSIQGSIMIKSESKSSHGFRHGRSKRKSKPQRAAQTGLHY